MLNIIVTIIIGKAFRVVFNLCVRDKESEVYGDHRPHFDANPRFYFFVYLTTKLCWSFPLSLGILILDFSHSLPSLKEELEFMMSKNMLECPTTSKIREDKSGQCGFQGSFLWVERDRPCS